MIFLTLILNKKDVSQVLDVSKTIEIVENAFFENSLNRTQTTERGVINLSDIDGWMGVMTAHIDNLNVMGTKVVTVFKKNINEGKSTTNGTLLLLNSESGDLLSIMDATFLTAVRTGAATGVATKYLSRKDSNSIGLFGAGVQARTQLEAICAVRQIEKIEIFTPTDSKRLDFINELSNDLGITIRKNDNRDTILDNDIIVTATTSTTPVFSGDNVKSGTHINCIGAHTKTTREIDTTTIKRGKLFVDSKPSALKEAGEILIPLDNNEINLDVIRGDLSDLVSKKITGRESNEDITIFKSLGLSIEDVSTAKYVFDQANLKGIGTNIEIN